MTLSLLFKANSGVCYNPFHENGCASGLALNNYRNLGQPGQNKLKASSFAAFSGIHVYLLPNEHLHVGWMNKQHTNEGLCLATPF